MTVSISMPVVPREGRPTSDQVQVPDTSVCILYPTSGRVHVRFHKSIVGLLEYDREQGWNNLTDEKAVISGANISKARNELVAWFLDETEDEWAWFIDTDMVVEPVVLPKLLCAAQVSGAKVMGGLCVMVDDTDGPIPTVYQLGNFGMGEITRVVFDYPDDTVMQVAATGGACLLIHRSVLEDIRNRSPENPYPWFTESVINGNWVSEDLHFCLLANSLGHPVFVDCTTHIGHAKHGSVWWPRDVKEGRGFPKTVNYAIVPIKDRLALTSSIVDQLRRDPEIHRIVVIDNGSNRKTKRWLATQQDVLVLDMPDAGIHEMWNAGAEVMISEGQKRNTNLFFLNNDLKLETGFAENAVRALRSDKDLVAVSGNYDGRAATDLVEETADICANRYDGTGGFAGFAFVVRGEWFQSGYRFPPECRWWYGDNDLVRASYHAGGKVGIALHAGVEHVKGGGQTGNWSDPAMQEILERDRLAYEERWARILASRVPQTLREAYDLVCSKPSDISEHLPRLVEICEELDAKRVIELGVRGGTSTIAWLEGVDRTRGHLWSVDVEQAPPLRHPRWTFVRGDDLDPFVLSQLPSEVDVVFIDTDHRFELTQSEIREYVKRVRPGGCLVFHDTAVETFEHHTTPQPPFPVRSAIESIFGGEQPELSSVKMETHENNHGLTIVWL